MNCQIKKERMITAIQPTNRLTLGNYLGAIKPFIKFQDKYDSYLFAANLHAITVRNNPEELKRQTIGVLAGSIASGVDPNKTTIFIQSQISAHSELALILNCYCGIGELKRMHQYKEKSLKQENINVGLFDYPVLMAADILLYDSNIVPVGEDQNQHAELTKDIAQRINSIYGNDTVVIPEFIKSGNKVMSLQDPLSKMSKSDKNNNATIFMDDSNDAIMKKFKSAVTDSGIEVTYEDSKPGIKNLINIQSALLDKPIEDILKGYIGKQYGFLKKETAEIAIEAIAPIRELTKQYMEDEILSISFKDLLKTNSYKADIVAKQSLNRIKDKIGLI